MAPTDAKSGPAKLKVNFSKKESVEPLVDHGFSQNDGHLAGPANRFALRTFAPNFPCQEVSAETSWKPRGRATKGPVVPFRGSQKRALTPAVSFAAPAPAAKTVVQHTNRSAPASTAAGKSMRALGKENEELLQHNKELSDSLKAAVDAKGTVKASSEVRATGCQSHPS